MLTSILIHLQLIVLKTVKRSVKILFKYSNNIFSNFKGELIKMLRYLFQIKIKYKVKLIFLKLL